MTDRSDGGAGDAAAISIADRDALARTPAHDLALDCLAAGIVAADPERAVRERVAVDGDRLRIHDSEWDLDGFDEVVVVGAGKAVVGMASALEALLGDRLDDGIVVSNTAGSLDRVTAAVGDHPTPSERGVDAAREVRDVVDRAGERTLVLAAFSGGGSALLPAPADDVPLADLRAVTDGLLAAGAEIRDVNAVRKHLSAVKGGRLARAAAPATVACLLVSDVVGDDPSTVASGPFVPDPTTYADALAALDDAGIEADEAPAARERLECGAAGDHPETPGPGDEAFDRVSVHVLASGQTALDAAAGTAREADYAAHVLDPAVTGEARAAAADHLRAARRCREDDDPVAPPAVLLSGGELTVDVRGDGHGGPSQEFCLAAALDCPGDVVVAAVDTDGLDGSTDAAGAIVDATTVEDRTAAGAALDENDAYPYLDARDALVRTGPTGTNVDDLRVVVVD